MKKPLLLKPFCNRITLAKVTSFRCPLPQALKKTQKGQNIWPTVLFVTILYTRIFLSQVYQGIFPELLTSLVLFPETDLKLYLQSIWLKLSFFVLKFEDINKTMQVHRTVLNVMKMFIVYLLVHGLCFFYYNVKIFLIF